MPFQIDPPPGENEVECGRCGAHVPISLNRCPECGVNLYEPDGEGGETTEYAAGPARRRQAGFLDKIGHRLRRLFGKEDLVDELFSVIEVQMALYQDLVRKVGGDREVAERLVEYEKQRHPEANRTVWLKNAITRWETDKS